MGYITEDGKRAMLAYKYKYVDDAALLQAAAYVPEFVQCPAAQLNPHSSPTNRRFPRLQGRGPLAAVQAHPVAVGAVLRGRLHARVHGVSVPRSVALRSRSNRPAP